MINATIIVQIIHFGVACFAIDRIILRKAVSQINDEKSKSDQQCQRIDESQARIAVLNKEKENAWRSVQEKLKALIPQYTRYQTAKYVQEPVEAQPINEQKLEAYKNELAQEIIGKVDHVH